MAAQSGNAARKRLLADLREIRRAPLRSVSALPLDDDIFTWHCNLAGPSESPYEGGIFHIELKFPPSYPGDPPSATIFSPVNGLPHPHIHGNRICMDLLGDYQGYFEDLDREKKRKKKHGAPRNCIPTGWSSAYSVQTILLQLQTFLDELDDLEDIERLQSMLRKIPRAVLETEVFSCEKCGHRPDAPYPPLNEFKDDSDRRSSDSDRSSSDSQSSSDSSSKSDHSIDSSGGNGYELSNHSPSESNLEESLVCFHSKRTFREDTLGIGLSLTYYQDSGEIKEINTSLDLLSRTAFYVEHVRHSVMKEKFTHWLPLYICPEHSVKARAMAKESISWLCTKTADSFDPMMVLKILPKIMSSMVVQLASKKKHASIKALDGYCAIHRLLLMFVEEFPELRTYSDQLVSRFCSDEQYRTKKALPSLGEFLPLLTVAKQEWKDVAPYYLEESWDRNVYWMLKSVPRNGKVERDPAVDAKRPETTFKACLVSFRLLMFHVYFLEHVACPPNYSLQKIAQAYDQRFGRPSRKMREDLQEAVREILAVNTWEGLFKRIGVPNPPREKLIDRLIQSVRNSVRKHYHNPLHPSGKRTNSRYESASSSTGSDHRSVCKIFLQSGHCRFGAGCKFAHVAKRNGGGGGFGDRRPGGHHRPTVSPLQSSPATREVPIQRVVVIKPPQQQCWNNIPSSIKQASSSPPTTVPTTVPNTVPTTIPPTTSHPEKRLPSSTSTTTTVRRRDERSEK